MAVDFALILTEELAEGEFFRGIKRALKVRESSNLWQPAESVERALGLLAGLTTGTALLKKFYPYFLSGTIRILPYPTEVAEALRRTREDGEFPGAACITREHEAVIYYDNSTPLGVLAVLLAHEISHALDASLWREARRGSASIRALRDSERMAIRIQRLVIQEMLCFYPDFVLRLIREFRHSKIIFPADAA